MASGGTSSGVGGGLEFPSFWFWVCLPESIPYKETPAAFLVEGALRDEVALVNEMDRDPISGPE